MVLETDGVCLLCEEDSSVWWVEVSFRNDFHMYYSQIWHWLFFFTTPFWIHETFTSSLSNLAYISGLNLVIKTYKKQKWQTIIHLVKRKKTTYGAACSLFCIHIPLASSINWQVHLYSSYNEGQRGTSMHQLQNICMVFSNLGSQFPPLRSYLYMSRYVRLWGNRFPG